MSNTKYRLTAAARSDLVAIGHYTEITWNRNQRQTLLARLTPQFQRLADYPGLGIVSGIAHPQSRSFPAHPFLIIYLTGDAGITILRVIHQRQGTSSTDTFVSDEE
jgi:toxin ParE1/3/4